MQKQLSATHAVVGGPNRPLDQANCDLASIIDHPAPWQ
jgi:hypothetical protein